MFRCHFCARFLMLNVKQNFPWMSIRTAALRRRAEVGRKGDGQWRGMAVVVVSSLERGFQGENLSVDDWGLLGDWGLRQYLQFKQLAQQHAFATRTPLTTQP